MKTISILFAFLLASQSISWAIAPQNDEGQSITLRAAINKAARQQELSQRIAKVYLALNNNLKEPSFYRQRDDAIELFQKHLDELKYYTPTEKSKHAVKVIKELWKEYQKVAGWSINKEGALKLLGMCDQMLNATKALVQAYEEYAAQLNQQYKQGQLLEVVKLIRETGRQRMFTQRIMLFYLAAKQDIDKGNSLKKLQATTSRYTKLINELSHAPINSPQIQGELASMKQYWGSLQNYLKFFDENPSYVNSMLILSDDLTKKADDITQLYQDLSKKLSISKAINRIAYQNMLTQRIAKAYVAITFGYSTNKYKRELTASVDLFEEQIRSIERSAPNSDIKEAIQVVHRMWKNYRIMALQWEDLDEIKVMKLLEKSHVIMASCDKVGQAIQEYAQTIPAYQAFFESKGTQVADENNIARQVHLAGMQRMYSQRVAVYFIMRTLKKDERLSDERLNYCIEHYESSYEALSNSTLNTIPMNQELHNSQQIWRKMVQSCTNNKKEEIQQVLDYSEQLFAQLDELNSLYEARMDQLIVKQ